MIGLLWFSVEAKAAEGRLYAVVTGVAKYRQAEMNLMYSGKDAVEMYKLLRLKTDSANLRLLIDEAATADNIIAAMNSLFARSQPDDVILFYFSGHGDNGLFFAYDRTITFSRLQAALRKSKARRKFIFADACMSGTLRNSGNASESRNNERNRDNRNAGSPNNRSNMDKKSDVLLFLSSRSDQTSRELLSLRNSVFTYFLIAGLKGGADANSDGLITARELFAFVNPKVREKTSNKQTPVMWGKFDDETIIMSRK
jgi:uncharacterized caspase-like protein